MWWISLALSGSIDFGSFAANPRDTLVADRATPRGMRIIALSNLADACGANRDGACVKRVVNAALSTAVRPIDPRRQLGDHTLYLSHLAIAQGWCAKLDAGCDSALHDRVIDHLAKRSAKEGVLVSFPGEPHRYPADQTATLYALHLYDSARGTTRLEVPLEAYRARMSKADGDVSWGLPPSELEGGHPWSNLPRGCALSWSVRYLAAYDEPAARSMWRAYKKQFLVVIGPVAGFREWPPGHGTDADVDSGPIVLGIGAAATAFGLAAARVLDDTVVTAQLESTEALGKRFVDARVADSALAVAITAASEALQGRGWAPPWPRRPGGAGGRSPPREQGDDLRGARRPGEVPR